MRNTIALMVIGAIAFSMAFDIGRSALAGKDETRTIEQSKRTVGGKTHKLRCVRYTQSMNEDLPGLDFSLNNRCDFAVECTIEWTVRCGDPRKKVDEGERRATIESKRRWYGSASAAQCGEGAWRIADVVWQCAADSPSAP